MSDGLKRFFHGRAGVGRKIIVASLLWMLLCATPLLACIAICAADANPIGLGLLAAFGQLTGSIGLITGIIWWAVEKARTPRPPV